MRLLSVMITISVAAASGASAAPIVLNPTADAYVSQAAATSNFGVTSPDTLELKNNTDANDRKIYFKFSLASVTATVTSATFDVSVSGTLGGSRTFQLWGLNDSASGQNWIESGAGSITWTNAPANDTTSNSATFTGDATLLASFDATTSTSVVSFSGSNLINFLNADTDNVITLMMFRTNNNATVDKFVPRSLSNAPSLTVVPEPAALGMLALGALCAMRRRG